MNSIVAGTFDILHDGHHALLDGAVKVTGKDKLTVGITTSKMLERKQHPVNDFMKRLGGVYNYLNGKVNFTMIDIDEKVPPKALEKDIECIVVSTETYQGALWVNQMREREGLNPLYIFVVPVVTDYYGCRLNTTNIRKGLIDIHGEKI